MFTIEMPKPQLLTSYFVFISVPQNCISQVSLEKPMPTSQSLVRDGYGLWAPFYLRQIAAN
jgi:hypothetical protein